jgi:hypothetical protein
MIAIVIRLQLIVFSCSRFSQNVGAPLAILQQLFASCVQKEQTHMVEGQRTQFCFCRIRPSAAFKCDMHISTPLEVTHATAVEIYIASKFITGLNSLLHKPWSDNRILQNGTENE